MQSPNEPSYQSPLPNPAGSSPPPGYPGSYTPGQPNGTILLVMGILGIIVCNILGPITWVMSNNALAEIDTGRGDPTQRSNANIAKILGIIGTVILILAILWTAFFGMAVLATMRNAPNMQGNPGVPPTMPMPR